MLYAISNVYAFRTSVIIVNFDMGEGFCYKAFKSFFK